MVVEPVVPANVKEIANNDQSLYGEIIGENDFPADVYGQFRAFNTDELNGLTESLNSYLAEQEMTVDYTWFSLDAGLFNADGSKYVPSGNTTVRLYIDWENLDGERLFHLKDDGTWEELTYMMYESSETMPRYIEFGTKSFSPFMFVKTVEVEEGTEEQTEEQAGSEETAEEVADVVVEPASDEVIEEVVEEQEVDMDNAVAEEAAVNTLKGQSADGSVSVKLAGDSDFPENVSVGISQVDGENLTGIEDSLIEYLMESHIVLNETVCAYDIGAYNEDGSEYHTDGNVVVRLYTDLSEFDEDVKLFHKKADSTWEELPYVLQDATEEEAACVEFTTTSFSPFLFGKVSESELVGLLGAENEGHTVNINYDYERYNYDYNPQTQNLVDCTYSEHGNKSWFDF